MCSMGTHGFSSHPRDHLLPMHWCPAVNKRGHVVNSLGFGVRQSFIQTGSAVTSPVTLGSYLGVLSL